MSKEDSLIFQTAVNHNQLLEFTEEEVDPADLAAGYGGGDGGSECL